MPTLGNALDFSKYEGRNLRTHQLGTAPAAPVTGQLYYNTADNTLYWWDGTTWVSARGGAAATPPATAGSLGTIQLAGDLAGTATSPQIAPGVITDADVNAANKDGAVGIASMRTIGLGAQQAMAGNTRLDTIAQPTASVNMNGQRIINMLDPIGSNEAATKNYVDTTTQGLDAKASVKVATTVSIGAGGIPGGQQTIDGYTTGNGDRVLVKDQSNSQNNGIYSTNTGGSWSRATDLDIWGEVPSAFVWVEQGTVNGDTGWVCTADQGGTIGTTPMPWTQFSGAAQIGAGAGLTKTGSILDVGAGAGIQVNADSIQVAPDGITNAMIADGAVDLASADVINTLPITKGGTNATTAPAARTNLGATGYYSSATHGAGVTITVPAATHTLGAKRGIFVQVQDEASGAIEIPDIVVAANGDVTVTYGAAVAANSKRVTVIG